MSKSNTIKVTLRGGEYEVSRIDSTHFGMRPAGELWADANFGPNNWVPYHIGQCHDEIKEEVRSFLLREMRSEIYSDIDNGNGFRERF